MSKKIPKLIRINIFFLIFYPPSKSCGLLNPCSLASESQEEQEEELEKVDVAGID
jgi:hypothetical protein